MDEAKRKDVSVGSGDTDGGETLAEPMEVVLEGNNGEDIMVEVLGSDVFVDGVRSHEGEGESGGEVGHGGPAKEAKPEAEVEGKSQETGTPGADLEVKSSEGGGVVSTEGQSAILKEAGSSEIDAEVRISELEEEEEGLIVEDTQLLDEETQPVEESLENSVDERDEGDGSKEAVVEGGEDLAPTGKGNEEQPVNNGDGAGKQKTGESTLLDEEKSLGSEDDLKSKESETRTDDVPEVGGEKVSVSEVENVSDRGEAKESVASGDSDAVEESHSVEVAGVPESTLNTAEDQKENGGSTEVAEVAVSDAEAAKVETENGDGMVDSNAGLEMEAGREVAEKETSDGDKKEEAEEEQPLKVETVENVVTVVTETVTVVTEVAETVVENDVSDQKVDVPVPDVSNAEETLPVEATCEETQIDVEMTEANAGVLDSIVEVSESTDKNQDTINEKRDVEDKAGNNDVEMADLAEGDGKGADEERSTEPQGENLQEEEENKVSGEEADFAGSMSAEEEEEETSGQENSKPQKSSSLKRKHNLRESTYPFKKGRTSTEDDDGEKSISVAKVTTAVPPHAAAPKPSFKVGECIKRIASQLTSPAAVKSKGESEPLTEDAEKGVGVEYSSMEDLLTQLQVAAQEPMTEHAFSNVIACFFSDFRNSVVINHNPELLAKSRKRLAHLDGSSEAFEFEDMNDSYWTDRVIENGGEEEPHSDGGGIKRVDQPHFVPVDLGKPQKTGRRPYRKRLQETTTNHGLPNQKPAGYIDANAPAELVMIFPEFGHLPSETSLSRMFKRFGPIRESETEVDRDTCRARVVFKKCCDAEVACDSAGRFNIFGPVQVTYQINYAVSEMFRSSGLAMMEVHEEDGILS